MTYQVNTKLKLTGQVLPGIMYVDKIVPEINSNMTYDYRDKYAYFKPISYQRALYATLQHLCYHLNYKNLVRQIQYTYHYKLL